MAGFKDLMNSVSRRAMKAVGIGMIGLTFQACAAPGRYTQQDLNDIPNEVNNPLALEMQDLESVPWMQDQEFKKLYGPMYINEMQGIRTIRDTYTTGHKLDAEGDEHYCSARYFRHNGVIEIFNMKDTQQEAGCKENQEADFVKRHARELAIQFRQEKAANVRWEKKWKTWTKEQALIEAKAQKAADKADAAKPMQPDKIDQKRRKICEDQYFSLLKHNKQPSKTTLAECSKYGLFTPGANNPTTPTPGK